MANLRLGSVQNFEFIEPPDSRLVTDGHKLLDGAAQLPPKMTKLTYPNANKLWIICV